jgi:hypothetical protein
MAKVGTYQNARQAAPYYVLLFPIVLACTQQVRLIRLRWWQGAALLVLGITTAYLGFVRGRTVLPVATMVRLQENHPHTKALVILGDYFAARASVESQRNFYKTNIPPDEKVLGYATTVGGAEPGLWVPFGQRQVKRVLPGDTPAKLRDEGIRYVEVEDMALQAANQTIEQWNADFHGALVGQLTFTRDPGGPLGRLYLVRLND